LISCPKKSGAPHQQREGKDVSEMRRVVARSERGYTLLELIIAIALILIVTAIGFPLYLSFSRAQ